MCRFLCRGKISNQLSLVSTILIARSYTKTVFSFVRNSQIFFLSLSFYISSINKSFLLAYILARNLLIFVFLKNFSYYTSCIVAFHYFNSQFLNNIMWNIFSFFYLQFVYVLFETSELFCLLKNCIACFLSVEL